MILFRFQIITASCERSLKCAVIGSRLAEIKKIANTRISN